MNRWKIDWFLAGMAVAVLLAWLFPTPGAKGGWMQPELLTKGGVALIFFLHGTALSFEALKAGAFHWRLHLVVQCCTFLLFPLLGLALLATLGGGLPPDLKLGFFYLAALPSTVSSSVALTAAARGDVPAAVFNATLSSLIGVLLTPLWMEWYTSAAGRSLPLWGVLSDLLLWLVLPLVVGQCLRPWLAAWAAKYKPWISVVDRLTILLLVYTSFCDSVVMGVWKAEQAADVLRTLVGTSLILAAALYLAGLACHLLGFSTESRIAAVFCGSKKSLASGVPMAQLMFAGDPGLGLILLPILIFHPLQLLVCAALAGLWARRPRTDDAA